MKKALALILCLSLLKLNAMTPTEELITGQKIFFQ